MAMVSTEERIAHLQRQKRHLLEILYAALQPAVMAEERAPSPGLQRAKPKKASL